MEILNGSEQRRARNEVLFREVNERVEEISDRQDEGDDPLMIFVCECGNTGCMEQIQLLRIEYEAIRANPKHFVVLPGHEDLRIARIVERHDGFFVAEKLGEAAAVAIQEDPRT